MFTDFRTGVFAKVVGLKLNGLGTSKLGRRNEFQDASVQIQVGEHSSRSKRATDRLDPYLKTPRTERCPSTERGPPDQETLVFGSPLRHFQLAKKGGHYLAVEWVSEEEAEWGALRP